MMHELLAGLARQTAIASCVILPVLLARASVRRLFGAELAYLLWLVVPLALGASLLPGLPAPSPVAAVIAPMQALGAYVQPPRAAERMEWEGAVLAFWLAGCMVFLMWTWAEHRRYRRGLGGLRANGDHFIFGNAVQGPAVVGLWRPVVVLPPDFAARYSVAERMLILAHEAVHVRRRDPLLNAVCALLQCVFWFNPIVHLGARRFRLDQELACDAAVMRAHAGLERSYAQAMFKTQLSAQASLVHCHWRSVHPLKERVMQLKQTPLRPARRLAGRVAVGLLVALGAGGGLVSHAQTVGAPQPGLYQLDMQLTANGMAMSPRLRIRAGEPFAVAKGDGAITWRGDFMLYRVNERDVFLKSVIKQNERVTGTPSVQVALGQPATISVTSDDPAGELRMQLTVTEVSPTAQ
jgi:bla regulator protein BlaR1